MEFEPGSGDASFSTASTLILPAKASFLPLSVVVSPERLIQMVPVPVAVQDAVKVLLVFMASSDASACAMVQPLTGPLDDTCTFHAAMPSRRTVIVKESPTCTLVVLAYKFVVANTGVFIDTIASMATMMIVIILVIIRFIY